MPVPDPCRTEADQGQPASRYAPEDGAGEQRAWTQRLGRDLTEDFSSKRRRRRPVSQFDVTGSPLFVDRCVHLFVDVEYIDTHQPGTQFGTLLLPGGEQPAGETQRRFNTARWNFAALFPAPVSMPFGNMFAKVSYYRYSGSNLVTVAPGGTDTAQTYIMPNPASMITGVLYGLTGETLNAQTEGKIFDVTLTMKEINERLSRSIPLIAEPGAGPGSVVRQDFGIGVRYRHGEANNTIYSQNITFPGIHDTTTTEVNYDFFGVNFHYGVGFAPQDGAGFFAGVSGSAALGGMRTDANAFEGFVCPFCVVTEQNVNLNVKFEDTRFAAIASGKLNVGYRFNRSSSLSASVGVEYMSGVPSVQLPTTPTQQPAWLTYSPAHTLSLGIRYTHTFDPQDGQVFR